AHERGLLACVRTSSLACTGSSYRDQGIAAACEGSHPFAAACPMHPLSVGLLCASPLPVRAEVLSTPARRIALALCSHRSLSGLIEVTPSLTPSLRATLLTPPHR